MRGASLTLTTGTLAPVRFSLDGAYERLDSVGVHATPASGRYEPTIGFAPWREMRLTAGADVPTRTIAGGFSLNATIRASGIRARATTDGAAWRNWLRGSATAELSREFGRQTLVLRTIAAGITSGDTTIPAPHLVYMGGPLSAPGYDFHTLVGCAGASQRIEWRFKVPFVSVPLGAWGRSPANLTLAPYANAAWVDGAGWRPSAGVGVLSLFDLLRFDVARGLRGGRWTFGFDVSRDFWGVL